MMDENFRIRIAAHPPNTHTLSCCPFLPFVCLLGYQTEFKSQLCNTWLCGTGFREVSTSLNDNNLIYKTLRVAHLIMALKGSFKKQRKARGKVSGTHTYSRLKHIDFTYRTILCCLNEHNKLYHLQCFSCTFSFVCLADQALYLS